MATEKRQRKIGQQKNAALEKGNIYVTAEKTATENLGNGMMGNGK